LQLAFSGDVPLGEFELKDGTLLYENRTEAVTERLDSLNVSLRWQSVRQPVSVTGSAVWRGEQVAVSAMATTPFAFLNGEATPLEARFDSARIAVVINGEWSNIEDPQLGGRLTMSTPSLRSFASWMGSPVGPGTTLGQASLEGQGTYRARTLRSRTQSFP
jgi:AsmA protein